MLLLSKLNLGKLLILLSGISPGLLVGTSEIKRDKNMSYLHLSCQIFYWLDQKKKKKIVIVFDPCNCCFHDIRNRLQLQLLVIKSCCHVEMIKSPGNEYSEETVI